LCVFKNVLLTFTRRGKFLATSTHYFSMIVNVHTNYSLNLSTVFKVLQVQIHE